MSGLTRRAAGIRDSAIAAAGTLRGRKFGMLVASSLLATSAIVAAAFTAGGYGPLAGLLGEGLAAGRPSSSASTAQDAAGAGGPAGPTSLPPPAASTTNTIPIPAASAPAPAAPAPAPAPAPAGPSAPSAPPDPSPPTPQPQAGRIKHVFIITLSSPGYEATFGESSQMPYLSGTLRPQGELLSDYSLLDAGPMPNYIAAVSGQPPNPLTRAGCPAYRQFPANAKPDASGRVAGRGCIYPAEATTIADQLSIASFSWHAYVGAMADQFGPGNCVHPDTNEVRKPETGGYQVQRNPFIYFRSLLDLGDCALNDVPFEQLAKDTKKTRTTPNYSLISPDLCDAGVPGQCPAGEPDGPAAADAFLARWVPKITATPAFRKDGLLVITSFDSSAPADNPDPKRVGALLLSPYVSTNTTSAAKLGPYSLLRTTEDLFGLQHLAVAQARSTRSFAAPLLGQVGGD